MVREYVYNGLAILVIGFGLIGLLFAFKESFTEYRNRKELIKEIKSSGKIIKIDQ